jgi:hypothetical protein
VTPRPNAVLLHDAAAHPKLLEAFELGCEEESVPVETRSADGDANALAQLAAAESNLFVGAGIDADGSIALHEQRLGPRSLGLRRDGPSLEQARLLGVALGRLIKGRPIPAELIQDVIEPDERRRSR